MARSVHSESTHGQLVTTGMQWLLKIATILVFIAGVQLYVQTEDTATYFAWTIAPPKNLYITAAFLGAGYWSSGAMEWLSSKEPIWARARIAVLSAFVFSTMTLMATLLHLNLFHFSSTNPITLTATWAWMIVYVAVPPVILGLLVQQSQVPGTDPRRQLPLAPWIRATLLVQGLVMLVLGVVLFVAPQMSINLWPWVLTPLTARAIAAWLLGLSTAALLAYRENDTSRVWRAALSFALFGLLNLIGLMRYWDEVTWNIALSIYILFLGVSIILGTSVLQTARRNALL